MATYSASSLGIKAPSGGFQNLGWYPGEKGGSYQYDAASGTFGESGTIHQNSNQQGAGQRVSNEVVAQTNPSNVAYLDASKLQSPVNVPFKTSPQSEYVSSISSEVANARKTLDETLGKQRADNDAKLLDLREKEKSTLDKIGTLTTPFREELEKTERERLHINENFEANQTLVNELDQLLTEGNNLIKQQQSVTGLASVRNPRIQKAMDDVTARAGVIQAVMSARNGQIAQAENMIDRSVRAISDDRNDQISYYETILNLNRQDILSLDDDNKRIANEQIGVLKDDLNRANQTATYVKELMLNPQTAMLMGQAGVSLNDSVDTINSKLSQAQMQQEVRDINNEMATKGYSAVFDPKSVPKDQLVTITDPSGNKLYFRKPPPAGSSSYASTFIQNQLNKGSGKKDSAVTSAPAISTQSYNALVSAANDMLAPTVSPSAGIGSTYIDGMGRKWIYERSGWRLA